MLNFVSNAIGDERYQRLVFMRIWPWFHDQQGLCTLKTVHI